MQEGQSLDFERLKCYSLFGGITRETFETIRPLIHIENYVAGEDVVKEGTLNDRIYLICSGSVEILKHVLGKDTGACRRITVMHTGDTFGEMELIDTQPCAATVRACEDTRTLTLTNQDLYKVSKIDMKAYALLIMNLARELSRRLRVMDEMLGGERPSVSITIRD